MQTKRLTKKLELLISNYAGSVNCEKPVFSREGDFAQWDLKLEKLTLRFVYTLSDKPKYPVSTLFCRIYFNSAPAFAYDIYDMVDYIGIFDYHCYFFSYIESRKRLEACFNYITDFIDYHFDELEELSERADKCRERKLKELIDLFDVTVEDAEGEAESLEEFADNLNSVTLNNLLERYTKRKAYIAFLEGDYDKALELYEQEEKKTEYEKKLISFISELYAPFQAIPDECASVVDAQEYKNDKKEDIVEIRNAAISVSAFIIVCSIPFFIAQLIINARYTRGALLANEASPLLAVFYGLLPGIFAHLILSERIEFFVKKRLSKAISFYRIMNPVSNKRVFAIMFAAFTFMSVLIFSSAVTKPSLVVFEDRFVYDDNDTFFSDYEQCLKNDIWEIYYAEGRYNESDKYVKEPSYVFKKLSGECVDTYDINMNETEEAQLVYYMSDYRGRDVEHITAAEEVKGNLILE